MSIEEVWNKCMKEVAMFEPQKGTNGAASFGHIVGGYSAGYYGKSERISFFHFFLTPFFFFLKDIFIHKFIVVICF